MLTWIIQISIFSALFIFLIHNIFTFFITTLTVPKVKDLVNTSNQKYQNIYDTISNNSNSYTDIDLLPTTSDDPTNMKNELKQFLKSQLNN